MPPRQLWIFLFGCWVALGTALLHLISLVVAPLPAPAGADADGLRAAAGFPIVFPDGTERSLGDLIGGFNLVYVLLLATIGGVGLAAARRDRDGAGLVDIARIQALACLALLVISLLYFFLIPTLLVAVMLVCFTLGAVRAPE